MKIREIVNEDLSRRGFLKGLGGAALTGAGINANAGNNDLGQLRKFAVQDHQLAYAIGMVRSLHDQGLLRPPTVLNDSEGKTFIKLHNWWHANNNGQSYLMKYYDDGYRGGEVPRNHPDHFFVAKGKLSQFIDTLTHYSPLVNSPKQPSQTPPQKSAQPSQTSRPDPARNTSINVSRTKRLYTIFGDGRYITQIKAYDESDAERQAMKDPKTKQYKSISAHLATIQK